MMTQCLVDSLDGGVSGISSKRVVFKVAPVPTKFSTVDFGKVSRKGTNASFDLSIDTLSFPVFVVLPVPAILAAFG